VVLLEGVVCVGMLCGDSVGATRYCFYASLHKSHFWTMSNLHILFVSDEIFCQWASDYVPKKHGLLGCFELLYGLIVGRARFKHM
jgi:hypothetical protein